MRLPLPLVALALVELLGACAQEPACPVVVAPAPAPVHAPPKVSEPARQDPPPTRREQALAFVKLGFGDELGGEFRSLDFRTEALSTDIARDAVQLVREYNAFAGVKVAAALEQLRGDIMYYEFGREASPVLHVHLPRWTHQQERSCPENHCREGEWGDREGARKLDAREHAALLRRVRAAFQAAQADEIGPVADDDHVLRIWWD